MISKSGSGMRKFVGRDQGRRGGNLRVLLLLGLMSLASTVVFPSEGRSEGPEAEAEEFFERHVRPILVHACLECHGSDYFEGGLQLTSREAMLKGGDSGPALVVPFPDQSLLIEAVGQQGDLRMPPDSRLNEGQQAVLARWIEMGAPWPAADGVASLSSESEWSESNREHWAFRPIDNPPLPEVKQSEWPEATIDYFVLEQLEKASLQPAPPADRRTLLRRVYYGLIGLPPSWEEVRDFVEDPRPTPLVFQEVVDRLLASPRHGERWGRHWLDVARYADTKDGVLMFGYDRMYPFAYTYRDYVIRAFNEDLPYDNFIRQQLVADQMEFPDEPWRLAALGWLTLGRLYDNNLHDVIDDRIDTVTRGFLGLTVSCARCHDHKYDPIPTADYYSLYGIFASCEAPIELPPLESLEETPERAEFERSASEKRSELRKFVEDQYALLTRTARERTEDYLVHVATTQPDPLETAIFFLSLAPEDLRPPIVARWRRLIRTRAVPDDPVFGLWHDLLASGDGLSDPAAHEVSGTEQPEVREAIPEPTAAERNRPKEGESRGTSVTSRDGEGLFAADRVAEILQRWSQKRAGTRPGEVNPLVVRVLADAELTSPEDVARAYGRLLRTLVDEHSGSEDSGSEDSGSEDSADEHVGDEHAGSEHVAGEVHDEKLSSVKVETATSSATAKPSSEALDAARAELLSLVIGSDSPNWFPKSDTRTYMSRTEKDALSGKIRELDRMAAESPEATPRAMVLVDAPTLHDPRIFIRGNPSQPGRAVPRQAAAIFSPSGQVPFQQGSGRRELAESIVAFDNPLTARVIVNRVWMHHFGEPFVGTPSDFGRRSDPPSHPALLDHLATRFMQEGWSLKKLHRWILLSATYQQASEVDSATWAQATAVDPDNRWLWRMNRKRLEFEAMRDTLLAVSGQLSYEMGGRSVDLVEDPQERRRTVYGLVDRQSLPAMFRAFDFASPDQTVERRPRTVVPQQALFAMNSPFVAGQAAALAERTPRESHGELRRDSSVDAPSVDAAFADDVESGIVRLYRSVFARDPNAEELQLARQFLQASPDASSQFTAWEQLAQVLLLSNELMYID